MHGLVKEKAVKEFNPHPPAVRKRRTNKVEIITLTPELATELLEHNTLNRPLRDAHVSRIAWQITRGKWRFNGNTIKISDDGAVLDGQHRLWAVIEARKSIETIVVYGVERGAFATIDTLQAPRNGADILSLNGVERYRTIMSNTLAWMIRWQRGVLETYRDPKNRIEVSDIEAAYGDHPKIITAIEKAQNLKGVVNPSIIAWFFYVLTNRNETIANRMMETLKDPASVAVSDPFFRLRSYFVSDHLKRKEALFSIALMIKAANAASRGEKIQLLTWRNQGAKAEPFPTLKID